MALKVKSITFKKNGRTVMKLNADELPRGYNDTVNKKNSIDWDQIRHKDFQRAMDKLSPHILIRTEFSDTMDRIDHPIDKKWFDEFAWEDDARYEGIEMTGIIIQGKEVADGVQLVGKKTMEDGGILELKTPSIKLYKDAEAYNYPFLDILSSQIETLLTEAENYVQGKTGAAKQMEIEYETSLKAV